jgi:hypothetical protein
MEAKVTSQMNERLLAALTVDEITHPLHQMTPLKAPGPDDFHAAFFSAKLALYAARGL